MERRHAAISERERNHRGRKVARLVEKITVRGLPFTAPNINSGLRVVSEPLRISTWTKTTDGHQLHYKEVLEHGVPVFYSTVLIQGQIVGPTEVLIFKAGPWQERLKGLARVSRQQTATQ